VCRIGAFFEVVEDPRSRALLDLEFRITPPSTHVGKGRYAENRLRHEFTNWDQLLHEAGRNTGGLLYPEQYALLRKGVDRIVAEHISTNK
jgi:hypothetical protein